MSWNNNRVKATAGLVAATLATITFLSFAPRRNASRLTNHETRITRVETTQQHIKEDVTETKVDVKAIKKDVSQIERAVYKVDAKLDRILDNQEYAEEDTAQ